MASDGPLADNLRTMIMEPKPVLNVVITAEDASRLRRDIALGRVCDDLQGPTEAVGHDTVLSAPFPARGFGLGVIDHPGLGPLADAAGAASA